MCSVILYITASLFFLSLLLVYPPKSNTFKPLVRWFNISHLAMLVTINMSLIHEHQLFLLK